MHTLNLYLLIQLAVIKFLYILYKIYILLKYHFEINLYLLLLKKKLFIQSPTLYVLLLTNLSF